LPDDRDHRNVDAWKDVLGCHSDGGEAQEQH
jgi:hypothetical protein